jgi:hypothetical protein
LFEELIVVRGKTKILKYDKLIGVSLVSSKAKVPGSSGKISGIDVGMTHSPNMTQYQLFHARLVFVLPARHWHGTLPWTIWEIAKHLK